MCEHREGKISYKRLMAYKKGLQRKEKYAVECFLFSLYNGERSVLMKSGRRFSLVRQPIYMLNQSKLYLGRQICLPISFSLPLYELKKTCFSFGCNGSWKLKYNCRTRKKNLEGSCSRSPDYKQVQGKKQSENKKSGNDFNQQFCFLFVP